ncbi:MAG TPA: ectoine/hydroxyectoine ABC transporter substrate-binding protein EhuB [Trueperaceae bacterium]|nr:ectoine/hydroxyectoine ABC transporter substrate-binding protein EhuB [Trueperaceae bacterium]
MANRTLKALTLTLLTVLIGALAFAQSGLLNTVKQRGYIRVAVANEIPYGYVDANGDAHGIAPDVATAVLKQMGITDIQWIVTEFGSLIPGLKANRFDMVAAGQNILPARCQQVLFSKPNSSYGEGLMVKAGNPDNIHGYEAFVKNHNLKMGIVSGADELKFAQAMGIPQNQLVMLPANADALSAVETGRIAAYAATGLTAERLAKKSDKVETATPFTQPVVNGKSVRSYGGFSFNKDHAAFVKQFDAALAAFQKTPAWTKILTGYGLTEQDAQAALSKTTQELCTAQ